MHILVADDEAPVAQLLASVCARGSHRVGIATSAHGVLTYVQAHRIDLLILDLDMPGTDGLDLVHEIRRMEANLPVIAMTNQTADYVAEDLTAAGGIELLCKPFSMDSLGICLALVEERQRYVTDLAAQAQGPRAVPAETAATDPRRGRSPVVAFDRWRERRRGAA